jgi:lipoprotein-anchoring transpeptidase ErfK/SrfK
MRPCTERELLLRELRFADQPQNQVRLRGPATQASITASRLRQLPSRGRDRSFSAPFTASGFELVLTRHLATVAAIAALLGPVALAHAQPDNERQEMMRGGATKKGVYNIFGLDGTDLGRTTVSYPGKYAPGTIVVDTAERRLYLIQASGSALRYGIGVGRTGFQWKGTHKITAKKENPDWTAPPEMIARQKDVPRRMKGGDPDNPLGTHAMYLGSTLYRIHGSPDADSVGEAESSGCFRMRNADVADLYKRVPVGTTVVVK